MTTQAEIRGLGKFVRQGFTLEHPDNHILLLLHEGKLVARFSQTGATKQCLRAECSLHLVKSHGR